MELKVDAERPPSKRLLLVDDEQNVLVGMRRYFQAAGFDVDCAGGREEAETLLSGTTSYDGVVVDLSLTAGCGPDGLRLLTCVRDHWPAAAVIVLTAYGSAEIQAEALRLGASAFFQKPHPLAEIRRTLEQLIAAASS